jgi:hypothetical protein
VNLPTNGTTIYVRLWTVLNGTTFLYNDYTYTEFSQFASAITSPAPGSTLTSASTTFTWNAGPAGTTGYGLNVGTSPGAANLVNIGPLSGTSVTVNLPTNGTTIYVRLWTESSGTPISTTTTPTPRPPRRIAHLLPRSARSLTAGISLSMEGQACKHSYGIL